jgi:hypothetical protein
MHNINSRQNETRQIQRLAAQRQLYSTAKRVLVVQLVLSGPIAAATVFAGLAMPDIKAYVALWGFTMLLFDLAWLNPWQRRLRESAAKVQEQFDCYVLDLQWNAIKAGEPEPAELVLEQSIKYQAWAHKMPPLTDWYSKAVDGLSLSLARLVCQRSNCWWDAKQRRVYATTIGFTLFALCVGVLGAGLVSKLSLADLLLIVVAPMASTFALGFRQITEHREAADRLDKLRGLVERTWKDALRKPQSGDVVVASRTLQDEIYDGRKRNPLIFDAMFRWFRDDNEQQMNHGADEFLAEALAALADQVAAPAPDQRAAVLSIDI